MTTFFHRITETVYSAEFFGNEIPFPTLGNTPCNFSGFYFYGDSVRYLNVISAGSIFTGDTQCNFSGFYFYSECNFTGFYFYHYILDVILLGKKTDKIFFEILLV